MRLIRSIFRWSRTWLISKRGQHSAHDRRILVLISSEQPGDPNTILQASTRRPTTSSNAPTNTRTSSRPCTKTHRLWSATTGSSTWTNRRTTTGDGENFDFGMVDVNGNPYPHDGDCHAAHAQHRRRPGGDSGPVCDSWATSGSGAACTANMPSSTTTPLTIVTTTLPTAPSGPATTDPPEASMPLAERPATHTPSHGVAPQRPHFDSSAASSRDRPRPRGPRPSPCRPPTR